MTMKETINIFCNKIKKLREQQDISWEELSKRSGVPQRMLEQLEQNILPEEMMVDDACELAKVFGCEVYELFE